MLRLRYERPEFFGMLMVYIRTETVDFDEEFTAAGTTTTYPGAASTLPFPATNTVSARLPLC